jgi:hypothetical protein
VVRYLKRAGTCADPGFARLQCVRTGALATAASRHFL